MVSKEAAVGTFVIFGIFVFMLLERVLARFSWFQNLAGNLTGMYMLFLFLGIALAVLLLRVIFGRATTGTVILSVILLVGVFIFVPGLKDHLPAFSIVIENMQSIIPGVG